jgi:hypothetical protein
MSLAEPKDIFKDGASLELEARMALVDLREALSPEPCGECGHQYVMDLEAVESRLGAARKAVGALPEGIFRKKLSRDLFSLLHRPAPGDGQLAAWLAEHQKQNLAWIDALLHGAGDALNFLEQAGEELAGLEETDALVAALQHLVEARSALRKALEGGE